jgi:dihydroorotate dehydrogenase electron transfer subunit
MTEATIFVEDAVVLANEALPATQFLLRLQSPKCAKSVKPGNFIQISCNQNRFSLKRPFSVLRASPEQGWIEILYKVVGQGSKELSQAKPDDVLQSLGPIGNSFELSSDQAIPLLLGGGVGIPPIVFFAEQLRKKQNISALTIMGSEIPFPFSVKPSTILVENMPDGVIAAMSLLEDLSIPSRLTSKQGFPGCFDGYIHELAEQWLQNLSSKELMCVEVFSCGPGVMLEAVANLCKKYKIQCHLSLEEYMACAVGGCAGCTVEIVENGQKKMKRVCVDGPIFSAESVYP